MMGRLLKGKSLYQGSCCWESWREAKKWKSVTEAEKAAYEAKTAKGECEK